MANRTKYALIEALKELLNTTTLDHITVKDIVDRAGVSRQTFYYHFCDIHQMLDWAFQNALKQLFDTPVENWRERLLQSVEYLRENRVLAMNVYRSLGAEYFAKGLNRALRPLIKEALHDMDCRVPINPEEEDFAVSFFLYGVSGTIIQWLDADMPENLDRMIATIQNLVYFRLDNQEYHVS